MGLKIYRLLCRLLRGLCPLNCSGTRYALLSPDSPDEMASGQLRAPILVSKSNSYAESGSRILTDPTGERRNRQFRQRFRGLRSCWANPSGESGLNQDLHLTFPPIQARTTTRIA